MRKRLGVGIVMLVLLVDRPNQAEAGAFATEFTQVLNHGQLVMEYIRQGEQLAKAIEHVAGADQELRVLHRADVWRNRTRH